jgi:putative Mg2+ transporter-C (MgtC) family protein
MTQADCQPPSRNVRISLEAIRKAALQIRRAPRDYGFSTANLSSRLIEEGKFFEYRMTIRCRDQYATEKLSQRLRGLPEVTEFRITPVGD